ncbi:TPA: porin, partial [Serratia marcescens]
MRRSRSITSIPASRPRWPTCKRAAANLPGIGDADLVKYLDLALNYSFNANMSTYVEYKLNL